ncbi:MAG: PPC domain-containing DNA-binding protein [Candidatus Aminicenantales bacterium]
MKHFVLGSTYIVHLEPGEKIIETLKALCERDKIGFGYFHGLGAVREAELGHFDPITKTYSWLPLSGPYEIAALYGNITVVEGKPFIHAHAVLGDRTFETKGGHLREAVVSAVCEVTLTRFSEDVGRKKDDATGLFVFDLKP